MPTNNRERSDIQKDIVVTTAAKVRLEADLKALEAREGSLSEQASEAMLSGGAPVGAKELTEVRANIDATRSAFTMAVSRISLYTAELEGFDRAQQVARFHTLERDIAQRLSKARESMAGATEQFNQIVPLLAEAGHTASFSSQEAELKVAACRTLCDRWSADLPQYLAMLTRVSSL